jgi:hypothetical protein
MILFILKSFYYLNDEIDLSILFQMERIIVPLKGYPIGLHFNKFSFATYEYKYV